AAASERLAELAAAAAVRAHRCQFTLYRFLQAAAAHELPTILLKGAALVSTAYSDPAGRHMIDIDVLVSPALVSRARAAAAKVGLGPAARALPAWFHRLVHFEQRLQPWLDGLVPLDLHWRLHSPALLLTVDGAALWRRRELCTV